MDKFNLLKNVRLSVFSFILNLALVVVSYKMVVVGGGVELLGVWSLLMAWVGIIRFGDVGMGGAAVRYISKVNIKDGIEQIQSYASSSVVLSAFVYTILSLCGYQILNSNLASILSGANYNTGILVLPLMYGIVLLNSISAVFVGVMQGLHFGYQASIATIFGNIIQLAMVVILVPSHGLVGLALAQIIQYISLNFLLYILVSRQLGMFFIARFSILSLKEMLPFSLKAQLANSINSFFEPLSKILLGSYGDLSLQGLYELAYKTVSQARSVVVAASLATIPKLTYLVSTDLRSAKDFFYKIDKRVSKSTLIILVLVVILSPIVSLLWIGQFESTYSIYVFWLSVGFVGNGFGIVSYSLALASGKVRNNFISSAVSLVILILFSWFFSFYSQDYTIVISAAISLFCSGLLIRVLNFRMVFPSFKGINEKKR